MAQDGPKPPPAPPAGKAPPPPPPAGKGPAKGLARKAATPDQESKVIERVVQEAGKMASEQTPAQLQALIAAQEPIIESLTDDINNHYKLIKMLKQRVEDGDVKANDDLNRAQTALAETKANPAPLIKQQAMIALLIQEANAIKADTQSNNSAIVEKAKASLQALIEKQEKANIQFRKEQYNPLTDKISKTTQKRQEVMDQIRTETTAIKAQIEQLTKESAVLVAQRQEFAKMDPDFLAEIDTAIVSLAKKSGELADLLKILPEKRKAELQRLEQEIDDLKITKEKLEDTAILFKARATSLQSFKEEKLSRTINIAEWENIIPGIFYHNLRKFIAFADDNVEDIAPKTVFEAYNDLAKQKGFDETVILAIAAGQITRAPGSSCTNRRSPKLFLANCEFNPKLEPIFNLLLTKFYQGFPHFAQTAGQNVLAQPAAAQAGAPVINQVNMPKVLQNLEKMISEEGPDKAAAPVGSASAAATAAASSPSLQGKPSQAGKSQKMDEPGVGKLGQRPAQDVAAKLDAQREAATQAAAAGDRALGVQYGKRSSAERQSVAQAAQKAVGQINQNLQLAQKEFDALTKLSSRVDELSSYLLKEEIPEQMQGNTTEARLQRAQMALEQAATPERIIEREHVGGFEKAITRYKDLKGKAPTPDIVAGWQSLLNSNERPEWREKARKYFSKR